MSPTPEVQTPRTAGPADVGQGWGAPVVGRPTREGGQSDVAQHILEVAAPRFYLEGIGAVSADAVIAGAGVSKVTFYRHFPTKDHLVEAYLETVAAAERSAVGTWRAGHPSDPAAVLTAYADQLAEQVCGPDFRGCPFLDAAAEYPDVTHPVRAVAERHREWLRRTAEALLAESGRATRGPVPCSSSCCATARWRQVRESPPTSWAGRCAGRVRPWCGPSSPDPSSSRTVEGYWVRPPTARPAPSRAIWHSQHEQAREDHRGDAR